MQEETNCHQPAEPGNCGGRFKRYFYDGAENHCSEFLYTGCGGNENNFVSRAACVTSCVEDTQLHIDEICSLELSAGNCSGLEIRYFYDIESEDCQPFNFSGCGAFQPRGSLHKASGEGEHRRESQEARGTA